MSHDDGATCRSTGLSKLNSLATLQVSASALLL
jgi:hypothetical protein